ncbi:MAG: peptidoglycan-binding domain-containing protein [Faecalibacterium prausnitzii]
MDGKFGAGTAAAVRRFQTLLRPDQRRRGGPHDMEQAVRGVQRYRQPAALL